METLTDATTGLTTSTYRYTAYGQPDRVGTTGDDAITGNPGQDADVVNPYRFNSKRFNGATGTYDMGFREYNPALNRYLSRDYYDGALNDLALGSDPWNTNRYAFAGGNPITGIELDGHCAMAEEGGCMAGTGMTQPASTNVTSPPDMHGVAALDRDSGYDSPVESPLESVDDDPPLSGSQQGHVVLDGCEFSPNIVGAACDATMNTARARGETIVGVDNIDLKFNIIGRSVGVRPDVISRTTNGEYVYIEAKYSPKASYAKDQQLVIPQLVKSPTTELIATVGRGRGHPVEGMRSALYSRTMCGAGDRPCMVDEMTLRREVAARLRADGFFGKGGTYRRDQGDGFFYTVDVGPLSKRPDISPHIGVRYEPLESLHIQFRDLPQSPNAESYGANLGYVLHGDFQIWKPPATSDDVRNAIYDGFKVLRSYMSLELIPAALDGVPAANVNPSAKYRMVIVPFMLKRPEEVRIALELARTEYCRHDDAICENFRRFEGRILESMSSWDSFG